MPRRRRPGSYPQRTDLNVQPAVAPPGQPYGQRKAQIEAQQAIPLPAPPRLDRPTENPDEPITAGLPVGPGPGPEAVITPVGLSDDDRLLAYLQAMYQALPNSDVARLLDQVLRR